MRKVVQRELTRRLRDQHGVVSRSQLRAIGVSNRSVRLRVDSGEWEKVGAKLLRLAGAPRTPEQQLIGLCLSVGPSAVVSHLSAAWLWRIADLPRRHHLTVPRTSSARGLPAEVHRPLVFPAEVALVRGIPCTNPLRTMVDVAGWCTPEELAAVLDNALAVKLVSIEALEAELARSGGRGKSGSFALRRELNWRKPWGLRQMSVLEARLLRLFSQAGITPVGTEVKGDDDLGYRLDVLMSPTLAVEVDGYTFHHSLEQMAEDARRRNRIGAKGMQLLLYTWKDVVEDGHRLLAEVRHALTKPWPHAPHQNQPAQVVQATLHN